MCSKQINYLKFSASALFMMQKAKQSITNKNKKNRKNVRHLEITVATLRITLAAL